MHPLANDIRKIVLPAAFFALPERMRSDSAIELLLMTAAHESRFQHLKQVLTSGNYGPALGLWQMEPIALADVWGRIPRSILDAACPNGYAGEDRLCTDLIYAARMARLFYWLKPAPLPAADDVQGLAQYAKVWWNTAAGKATVEDYATAYTDLCI